MLGGSCLGDEGARRKNGAIVGEGEHRGELLARRWLVVLRKIWRTADRSGWIR